MPIRWRQFLSEFPSSQCIKLTTEAIYDTTTNRKSNSNHASLLQFILTTIITTPKTKNTFDVFVYLFTVCVCMSQPQQMPVSQRTTGRHPFRPSTVWVPEITFTSSGLVAHPFTTEPCCWLMGSRLNRKTPSWRLLQENRFRFHKSYQDFWGILALLSCALVSVMTSKRWCCDSHRPSFPKIFSLPSG